MLQTLKVERIRFQPYQNRFHMAKRALTGADFQSSRYREMPEKPSNRHCLIKRIVRESIWSEQHKLFINICLKTCMNLQGHVSVKEVKFTDDSEKNQWEYSQRGIVVEAVGEANTKIISC